MFNKLVFISADPAQEHLSAGLDLDFNGVQQISFGFQLYATNAIWISLVRTTTRCGRGGLRTIISPPRTKAEDPFCQVFY